MRVGIDVSFLRKPGTGIHQVTFQFLRELSQSAPFLSQYRETEFLLYVEEIPELPFTLPKNFSWRPFLPWWRRDDLLRRFLWERQVNSRAKRDACEVFLSLSQSATVFCSQMIRRHVMVVHDLIPRLFPEYQGTLRKKCYWRRVERGIRQASAIVAISQATRHDLVEFGIPGECITVAYPGGNPIFLTTPTQEDCVRVLKQYQLTLGYIYHGGGLEMRKNTEQLLRSYARLVIENKFEIPPLVISGRIFSEDNPLATPVRSLVETLHLTERVHLLDFVPEADLPALYAQALFFVYPSRYEGFGLPVLEALSVGTPVLTADNSSLPEVAGEGALYIDADNEDSLISGLRRMIDDVSLRETLIKNGRIQAQKFRWHTFVETVMNTLVQIS